MQTVFVQYDWFDRGMISVELPSGADVTPAYLSDYVLGQTEDGRWLRSTRVFEVPYRSDTINVIFTLSGNEPYLDSFSITTGQFAAVPAEPLRHEKDWNLDGVINLSDFVQLALEWKNTGELPFYDLTGNGEVGLADLAMFTELWLTTSPYRFVPENTGH